MKITIEINTEMDTRTEFVRAANSLLAVASIAPVGVAKTYAVEFAPCDAPVDQKPEPAPEPVKQTRAPRQAKPVEPAKPVEQPAPEPAPEKPVETPAAEPEIIAPSEASADEVRALSQQVINIHKGGDNFRALQAYMKDRWGTSKIGELTQAHLNEARDMFTAAMSIPAGQKFLP